MLERLKKLSSVSDFFGEPRRPEMAGGPPSNPEAAPGPKPKLKLGGTLHLSPEARAAQERAEQAARSQEMMKKLDMPDKTIAATIVHHANLKINQLKEKHLHGLGVQISMPWVLSEFGNVSAASNMIAFLRQLPSLNPGDHILIDGFGAGTYYDALVVALGGQTT